MGLLTSKEVERSTRGWACWSCSKDMRGCWDWGGESVKDGVEPRPQRPVEFLVRLVLRHLRVGQPAVLGGPGLRGAPKEGQRQRRKKTQFQPTRGHFKMWVVWTQWTQGNESKKSMRCGRSGHLPQATPGRLPAHGLPSKGQSVVSTCIPVSSIHSMMLSRYLRAAKRSSQIRNKRIKNHHRPNA